jgi:mannosyltransferase OCH1-like enzyme
MSFQTTLDTLDTDTSLAIPKLIMQTWKTEELPEKWKPTQTSIAKYMPNWKYILMTDEMNRAFITKYFPDFLPYYDAFPYPIQRADAIRYAWLYINGGLYFDCDFKLLGPLDELFIKDNTITSDGTNSICLVEDYDLFLLASSNTPDVITNGFIAAKPGNRLFLEMIEEMKKPAGFSAIERHLLVMNTTGPLAFNRVIKRLGVRYKQLPSYKINPYTLCEHEYNKPNALMEPLEGSSWVGGTAAIYQWCYCHYNLVLIYGITISLIIALFLFFFLYR